MCATILVYAWHVVQLTKLILSLQNFVIHDYHFSQLKLKEAPDILVGSPNRRFERNYSLEPDYSHAHSELKWVSGKALIRTSRAQPTSFSGR